MKERMKWTMKRFRFGSLGIGTECVSAVWVCVSATNSQRQFHCEIALMDSHWEVAARIMPIANVQHTIREQTTNWIINSTDRPRRTIPSQLHSSKFVECNESKSCYFLVSVFIVSICKLFFFFSWVLFYSVVRRRRLHFRRHRRWHSKSLSKSKMNFSFALLRPKQDNEMGKERK